jgi:hypothetical protein
VKHFHVILFYNRNRNDRLAFCRANIGFPDPPAAGEISGIDRLQGTKLPRHRNFSKDVALWNIWPKHGPAKIPSDLTQLQAIEQRLQVASAKYLTAADVGDVEAMKQAFNEIETLSDHHTKATPGVRDAGRLYLFIVAEELYPNRFQELKRRALPLIKQKGTPNSALIVVRRGHARCSVPAAIELERRIADWVRGLGIVRSKNGVDDFWLRQLAMKRLEAWHKGQSQMPMPSFSKPSRRSDESKQGFGKRNSIQQAFEDPRAMRVFKHHFVWFLRYRMEGISSEKGISLEHVGRLCRANPNAIPPTAAAVLYGVQRIADLIEVSL